MDLILYKLRKARYIFTIDMSKGYYQIQMHKDSVKCTAFAVPGMGLFEFLRLPFSLSGALAIFQELMDKVIGPKLETYCFCYLDDIILATEDFDTHLKILERILLRLRDANLTINRGKSFFCVPEAKYLGFIIDRDGFRPNPEKVSAVLSISPPRT